MGVLFDVEEERHAWRGGWVCGSSGCRYGRNRHNHNRPEAPRPHSVSPKQGAQGGVRKGGAVQEGISWRRRNGQKFAASSIRRLMKTSSPSRANTVQKQNVVVDFSPPTKSRAWQQKSRRSNLTAPISPLQSRRSSSIFPLSFSRRPAHAPHKKKAAGPFEPTTLFMDPFSGIRLPAALFDRAFLGPSIKQRPHRSPRPVWDWMAHSGSGCCGGGDACARSSARSPRRDKAENPLQSPDCRARSWRSARTAR